MVIFVYLYTDNRKLDLAEVIWELVNEGFHKKIFLLVWLKFYNVKNGNVW